MATIPTKSPLFPLRFGMAVTDAAPTSRQTMMATANFPYQSFKRILREIGVTQRSKAWEAPIDEVAPALLAIALHWLSAEAMVLNRLLLVNFVVRHQTYVRLLALVALLAKS